TNAITVDGRLVNLDGVGNRVAPMLFGPDKVVIVAGMNKVAADLESAFARVRTYAAPANNQRLAAALGLKNPCLEDGRCHQCMSETKICNVWTVIEGQNVAGRIHVILVAEDLDDDANDRLTPLSPALIPPEDSPMPLDLAQLREGIARLHSRAWIETRHWWSQSI
ncbi:MAG: hypothetical protein EOM92_15895, partial [Gammaproteobacteria bacterium]|nr:hypothetical protein [Gammaproteobacteria bacterium]